MNDSDPVETSVALIELHKSYLTNSVEENAALLERAYTMSSEFGR